jgi:hypothetical protein
MIGESLGGAGGVACREELQEALLCRSSVESVNCKRLCCVGAVLNQSLLCKAYTEHTIKVIPGVNVRDPGPWCVIACSG